MKSLLSILFLLIFGPLSLFSQDHATGVAFHDRNANGNFDSGEEGIEGVLVSNGSDVVATNSLGEYTLPVTDDVTLFVIKPRGWMTPVGGNGLPQFYRNHKPGGSQPLKYAGIPPTGPLPEAVNFPLVPQIETDTFSILVFGDPQPYTLEQVDFVANDIVKELIDVDGIAFGITLGDIVGDDLSLYESLNDAIGQIGIPWYNVTGNHDMNLDAPSDLLANETFRRVFGPPTYAFTYGRVHFIVIDDIVYPSGIEGLPYIGGYREDQLRFIKNFLAHVPQDDQIVMSMHIPMEEERDTFRHEDRDRLFRLFENHPNLLTLSAHTHMQRHDFFDRTSGWLHDTEQHHYNVGTTSGSWWRGLRDERDIPHTTMRDGTPNGYAFLHFDGTSYVNDWITAGRPRDYQMNIFTEREITEDADSTDLRLLVNFFNGNEKSNVHFRFDSRQSWQEMTRTEAPDPYYLKLDDRWQTLREIDIQKLWDEAKADEISPTAFPGVPLPQPVPSTHLWYHSLPDNLPAGTYRIEVRATDMYGRFFFDNHTFRVVPSVSEAKTR